LENEIDDSSFASSSQLLPTREDEKHENDENKVPESNDSSEDEGDAVLTNLLILGPYVVRNDEFD